MDFFLALLLAELRTRAVRLKIKLGWLEVDFETEPKTDIKSGAEIETPKQLTSKD